MEFELGPGNEYIELIRLLKAVNVAESGGHAQQLVEQGHVRVDGHREYRKRAKIRRASTVEVFDTHITIK